LSAADDGAFRDRRIRSEDLRAQRLGAPRSRDRAARRRDSEDGKGWYWYETFSVTPGTHGIQGQGAPICVNCHASGRDFVLTPFPLR